MPKTKIKEKKPRPPALRARKIRFSAEEMNKIQMLADIYAGGNFSLWVRHGAMNCDRKVLVKP